MSKLLSIIIPTCHRNDLLSLCLDRLAPGQQSLGFEHYEVIVSDDGSKSTAADMIAEKYPWARWVEGPKKGPAANRNNGAKLAKGEWLVFTDDDCLPDTFWLEAYFLAIAETSNIHVLEGRTYADRERRRLDEESPINETGGYLWSCNFAIQKDLFFVFQGFDEEYPFAAMEDVDLYYRLKKEKIPIIFQYTASVCHPWRKIGGWKKMIKRRDSTLYYLKKYPENTLSINSYFYLIAFITSLKVILRDIYKFRGKGIWLSLNHTLRQLYLSIYFLFKTI